MSRFDQTNTSVFPRPSSLIGIFAFFLLSALIFITACSRSSTGTYKELEATLELLVREDSVSFSNPFWAPSGLVYYLASPENGDSTALWEHHPETGEKRLITRGVTGPIAVAHDGKIAVLETSYRIVILDSTGAEVWAINVGSSVSGISFSADNEEIYYCKNGNLLVMSIGSSQPRDTILKGITAFRKCPDDSIFIYYRISTKGVLLHSFYKYDIMTGEHSVILEEGFAAGFDLNPASIDELAVGLAGTNTEELLGRRILVYHINYGLGRVFEAYPYDESFMSVESWAPDGSALLITVTPYLEADSLIPLPKEIWIARDIY
jgi:hypothetical protein